MRYFILIMSLWTALPCHSVISASVTMATYRSCVVFVLLCILYAVISVKIQGTVKKYSDYFTPEVEVSENINGENWINTGIITLDRLVEGNYLPTLTLTNIKATSLIIKNISLENVPVFENTSIDHIVLSGNKIKYVPTNAFNGAQMLNLYLDNNVIQSMSIGSIHTHIPFLYLRCNKLSDFSQDWFKYPSSIRELYLSGNQIENIQDHAFNQMSNLHKLDLSNNYIKRIGSEAFSPAITELHLQFNGIEQLTVSMFASRNEPLWYLYIHHNQLSYLTEALLLKMKLKHISLDGNPWQCECLWDIARWIREQNISQRYLRDRRVEPICVVPSNFHKVCVPSVDKELQQTYARGLSPVQGCLLTPCQPCLNLGLD